MPTAVAVQMIDATVRILHVMAVVVWIGHNWSNVVQTPFYRPALPADPDDAVREVAIAASKREHGIFRYASLIVLTTGLFMLWRRGDVVDALTLTGPSAILGAGIWVAIIMLLNLWAFFGPIRKRFLALFKPLATSALPALASHSSRRASTRFFRPLRSCS